LLALMPEAARGGGDADVSFAMILFPPVCHPLITLPPDCPSPILPDRATSMPAATPAFFFISRCHPCACRLLDALPTDCRHFFFLQFSAFADHCCFFTYIFALLPLPAHA